MMAVTDRVGSATAEPDRVFTINIRFHVYPQGGRWYAASTDYVLMAEGATEVEAAERFVASTMAYVETALHRGWIDALNRRPNIFRRLEIRRRVFQARLLRRHPREIRRHLEFPQLPLRLA
jgi:hypothetical protein